MKPKLCAAGVQLRDQVDTWFPDRCTKSPEGWVGDSRHSARKSDHNPDEHGWVRGQLILILGWSHPTASHLIWLTRSESQPKPIHAYHTSSITGEYAQRY
jgi:hypothetical protein